MIGACSFGSDADNIPENKFFYYCLIGLSRIGYRVSTILHWEKTCRWQVLLSYQASYLPAMALLRQLYIQSYGYNSMLKLRRLAIRAGLALYALDGKRVGIRVRVVRHNRAKHAPTFNACSPGSLSRCGASSSVQISSLVARCWIRAGWMCRSDATASDNS